MLEEKTFLEKLQEEGIDIDFDASFLDVDLNEDITENDIKKDMNYIWAITKNATKPKKSEKALKQKKEVIVEKLDEEVKILTAIEKEMMDVNLVMLEE